MTFLNRGRPIFGRVGKPSEPAPEPVTASPGLPVAAPAPSGVTDDLRAARRINALAFNAVTRALSDADVFVRLSDRQHLADAVLEAVLEAVQDEHERQIREEIAARIDRVVVLVRRDQSPADAKTDAYAVAAMIARGDR